MLNLNQISLKIKEATLVTNVTIGIARGEIFGLLGPNGSGKSSTLAVIANLLSPTSGSIVWENENDCSGLSVVFQTPSLDKRLTVLENLALTCQLFGIQKPKSDSLISVELEKAGLQEHVHKKVMQLSGGLKRRVDLVRALISEPSVLLLDEPTSGLDENSFRKFWDYLLNFTHARQNSGNPVTVVIATHDPREAEHCHRLAVFAKGIVKETASPKILKARLSKDIVTVGFSDESNAQKSLDKIQGALSVSAYRQGGEVIVDSEDGAHLIPRIAEMLERSQIQSISLKSASMAEVFFRITGEELGY